MANIDITKVIESGADTVQVYKKVVTEDPGSTAVAFAATDLISYLQGIDGMGASKEVATYRLFHKKDEVKNTKGSNINDVNFTEALTKDALDTMRGIYDANSYLVSAAFDKAGNQLFGYFGQISQWGMTLPDNDVATLTYTMSVSSDGVTATQP